MNDSLLLRVAPDVVLGRDVKLYAFVNLYGCTIGDESKIGTFVEIQTRRGHWLPRQDVEPHFHLRGGDHRGRGFHRPRRDVHQRQIPARHERYGGTPD